MFWEVICVIDYKQEIQGLVIINEEINSLITLSGLDKAYGVFLSD
jgi:hypothetical protein